MAGQRMFTASFTGQETLVRNCRMLREKVPEWLAEANQETANEMFDEARRFLKQSDTYATGDLYDSVVTEVSARGLAIWVGSQSPYAAYVEFGTRPHFPPLDAIRAWCRVKGIPESAAFPIARQISVRGTPAIPFMRTALAVGRRHHLERIRRLITLGIRGALGRAA